MTIRKRLFWSNILMIVVPVIMTAIVGMLCVCMVWLVIRRGPGFGFEDSGDFYWAGRAAAEAVTAGLDAEEEESRRQLDRLTTLLDAGSMRLVVVEDGSVIYTYGERQRLDEWLMRSAEEMDMASVQVSVEGRSIYLERLSVNGQEVLVSLLG